MRINDPVAARDIADAAIRDTVEMLEEETKRDQLIYKAVCVPDADGNHLECRYHIDHGPQVRYEAGGIPEWTDMHMPPRGEGPNP